MNKTNQVNIAVRMNNKKALLLGIALMLLFTGIAIATSSASSGAIIYAFDQKPAGSETSEEFQFSAYPNSLYFKKTTAPITKALKTIHPVAQNSGVVLQNFRVKTNAM